MLFPWYGADNADFNGMAKSFGTSRINEKERKIVDQTVFEQKSREREQVVECIEKDPKF